MKQLFYIKGGETVSGQQLLLMRLGAKHGCFAISDKSGKVLHELAYVTTANWEEKELNGFFNNYPALQQSFYECQVAYDFPGIEFVPTTAAYGLSQDNIGLIKEQVPGWQHQSAYIVPAPVAQWMHEKFPAARFRHEYTSGIKTLNFAREKGSMLIDFQAEDFSVMVGKAGKFLLARSFPYSIPDDVLYYLIRICRQFGLSQETVELSVSGLIEQQSSLYRELYQYFINISFRDADWNAGNEYPAHFFTSLNDLAKCVS